MANVSAKAILEFIGKDVSMSKVARGARSTVVGAFKEMTKSALNYAGAGAAVAGVGAALDKAIDASVDHQRVMRMANTAGVANIAMYDKQAETLEHLVGVSSDLVIQQQAIGVAQGMNTEMSWEYTNAALAASRAIGRDFISVHNQLLKTLGGTLGELSEIIPAMKELSQAELRAGKAAEFMMRMFGGTLQGDVKNVSLQIKVLAESVGDLWGAFGDRTLDVLFGGAEGYAQWLREMSDGVEGMVSAIASADLTKFERFMAILRGKGDIEVGGGGTVSSAFTSPYSPTGLFMNASKWTVYLVQKQWDAWIGGIEEASSRIADVVGAKYVERKPGLVNKPLSTDGFTIPYHWSELLSNSPDARIDRAGREAYGIRRGIVGNPQGNYLADLETIGVGFDPIADGAKNRFPFPATARYSGGQSKSGFLQDTSDELASFWEKVADEDKNRAEMERQRIQDLGAYWTSNIGRMMTDTDNLAAHFSRVLFEQLSAHFAGSNPLLSGIFSAIPGLNLFARAK